jgi:hypothetical protein
MSIRFIAWADGRSGYASSRGLCVYNILGLWSYLSTQYLFCLISPLTLVSPLLRCFRPSLRAATWFSILVPYNFFKNSMLIRCIVGHTNDQRSVPGVNRLTSTLPAALLTNPVKWNCLLSAKRLLSRCTETVGGIQTHLGTAQDPFSYVTLTANRNLVDFTMIGVCVSGSGWFCKRQAVLWILLLVEVLSLRLQHLNYYKGWHPLGTLSIGNGAGFMGCSVYWLISKVVAKSFWTLCCVAALTALLPVRLDIRSIHVKRRKACCFGCHELYKVIFD